MSVPTIQAALAAVMADVGHVGKTGKNSAHGYSFRGIDAVLNAVGPVLRAHSVVVLPTVESTEHRDVEVGSKRTPMRQATVVVRYDFHGPAGDVLSATVPAEAMDSGDKATSKAMSVAYRTALIQALTLPTDEPDPDEFSYERAAPPADNVRHLESARAALAGEPPPDSTAEMVDTAGILGRLKGLDPDTKGKVKARLERAGLPSQTLPAQLDPECLAQIDEQIDLELEEAAQERTS